MRHRPLKDLDALLGPERVKAAKARAQKKLQGMLLADLRKQRGLTQAQLAKAAGVSQSALSQMESQDDMQIGTLRKLVAALDGNLRIIARFRDRDVVLSR